ncbi:ABC transporter permease [Pseudomonas sp. F1_0610]|uniref:ABC transporter permease n=1 Tax=Pseudomonas sp. F1_0610 TaxID=3114284 RepID=UPI0039C3D189
MTKLYLRSISLFAVVVVIAVWQLSSGMGWIASSLLLSPSELVKSVPDLVSNGYRLVPLYEHIWVSCARAFSAFLMAIVLGVPLGLIMGRSPVLNAILDPFVQFLRPIPKIALIPLVVLWLGIGEGSKFFLIFIATFLSVVVGAAAASRDIPEDLLRAARNLGASPVQIIVRVILPYSLPALFTTARLSIGIGWTSLVAAEMVAATSGLGWMILNAGNYLRTDVVILGIIILGGIGYLLDFLLIKLQARWVPWAGKDF